MHEGCAAEYIILIGSQIPVGNLPVASDRNQPEVLYVYEICIGIF